MLCNYRSPNNIKFAFETFYGKLEKLLRYCHQKMPKSQIILAGDYIILSFFWTTLKCKLLGMLNSYHLSPVFINQTRITVKFHSCIDYFVSLDLGKTLSMTVESGLSDHINYAVFPLDD